MKKAVGLSALGDTAAIEQIFLLFQMSGGYSAPGPGADHWVSHLTSVFGKAFEALSLFKLVYMFNLRNLEKS